MVKYVRIPLTDVNGRDFVTGEIVEKTVEVKQTTNLSKKLKNWKDKKLQEAKEYWITDWRIHVEGFGWVKL